jgi:hypothetical protein
MNAKMDRPMSRTPQDVERKYDLTAIAELDLQIKELKSMVETLLSEVQAIKESTQ